LETKNKRAPTCCSNLVMYMQRIFFCGFLLHKCRCLNVLRMA
jgi:hypothetical protein